VNPNEAGANASAAAPAAPSLQSYTAAERALIDQLEGEDAEIAALEAQMHKDFYELERKYYATIEPLIAKVCSGFF
jgi:hypothetical protein